jgi:hypothetical protein
MRFVFVMALMIAAALPLRAGRALQMLEYTEETFSTTYVVPFVNDFTTTPEGGLAWTILAGTKEIPYEEKDAQGNDIAGVRPDFPAEVAALDGQVVTMQGFMFPLGAEEKQTQFLFGPFPASCPYHYHVGAALVIEVTMAQGLPFTYDPVTLTGRLELVPRDDMFNVFYRLHDAKAVR